MVTIRVKSKSFSAAQQRLINRVAKVTFKRLGLEDLILGVEFRVYQWSPAHPPDCLALCVSPYGGRTKVWQIYLAPEQSNSELRGSVVHEIGHCAINAILKIGLAPKYRKASAKKRLASALDIVEERLCECLEDPILDDID